MYVEKMRDVAPALTQPMGQTAEIENTVRAQSKEGKQKIQEQESEVKKQAADSKESVVQLQSAEMEKIRKAAEKMREQLPNSEPKFGIHEATNRVMIKIVDKDSKEVIKELPPEKTLDILARNLEMAGVLVDKKL